jgi:hypothetical protein
LVLGITYLAIPDTRSGQGFLNFFNNKVSSFTSTVNEWNANNLNQNFSSLINNITIYSTFESTDYYFTQKISVIFFFIFLLGSTTIKLKRKRRELG